MKNSITTSEAFTSTVSETFTSTTSDAVTESDVFIEFIFPVLLALVSAAISYFLAYQKLKQEMNKIKKEQVYNIKKDTLLEALDFCDTYLSWHQFSNDKGDPSPIPIRDDSVTTSELTFKGREIYNKLCITCKNKNTIKCFNELIYGSAEWSTSYKNFRNAVRKELGLARTKMNNDRVFVSRISTIDLWEKDKNMGE